MSTRQERYENPIHCGACRDVAWSTFAAAALLPGVVTPLTWSFFGDATERAIRHTLWDLGVLRRDQVEVPEPPEERLWETFYGRTAMNLDRFRWVVDHTPGAHGTAVEAMVFGSVPAAGSEGRRRIRRYPFVAFKAPVTAPGAAKALDRAVALAASLWQSTAGPGGLSSPAAARTSLAEANELLQTVMIPHALIAIRCRAVFTQLRRLAERAQRPGLELRLIRGYGAMAEIDVVSDVWEVSRERLGLDEVLGRYGYLGLGAGEFASRVWRTDRQLLRELVDGYRALPESRDPRVLGRDGVREREVADRELLAATPPSRRAGARRVLRTAATLIPRQGRGRAALLQCVDVARASAEAIGAELVADGLLERPEDVCMLTVPELVSARLPASTPARAAGRRERHDEYRQLDVPDRFDGVPAPFPFGQVDTASLSETIAGTPGSPGVAEARARVISAPGAGEAPEAGEIAVCRTAGADLASALMLASALVIDTGGPLGPGASVARELGIPCVVDTRDGSRRIALGELIRVDGERGEIRVLAPR